MAAGTKITTAVNANNTRKIGKVMKISLQKGPLGLGFSITTRDNAPGGNTPIYIKNIRPKGENHFQLLWHFTYDISVQVSIISHDRILLKLPSSIDNHFQLLLLQIRHQTAIFSLYGIVSLSFQLIIICNFSFEIINYHKGFRGSRKKSNPFRLPLQMITFFNVFFSTYTSSGFPYPAIGANSSKNLTKTLCYIGNQCYKKV